MMWTILIELRPPALTLFLGYLAFLVVHYLFSFFANEMALLLYLKSLAITGAMGGVIHGFIKNEGALHWVWPDESKKYVLRCGSLADAFIGIGGAWGVFFVLGRSMKLGTAPEDLLALVGLGVVAGLGARTLLEALSTRLAQALQIEKAKEKAEKAATDINQLSEYATSTDINIVLDMFDMAPNRTMQKKLKGRLEGLRQVAERIIQKGAPDAKPYLDLARIKKRLASISPENEQSTLLAEAISLCDQALKIESDAEDAYYNRACYKALFRSPIDQIVEDMKNAIRLNPQNKEMFQEEPDLKEYLQQTEIKEIIGGS